ncbi:hypothetical protein [Sulfurimicrobium lacus]|uniref:hypothetical protein n=1 Tax=Sulfurimicrobium lacus TaxID=2715678 RepID=UPI00156385AA|nr:hypothetical protein [Sulfurimicrobium lacus]
MPFPAPQRHYTISIPIFAATEPVGGLDYSLPIHSDHGSSQPQEYWEDQLHKRKPGKRKPQPLPEKPHDPSHQVDDYA